MRGFKLFLVISLLSLFGSWPLSAFAQALSRPYEIPNGMVAMVDVGGDNCAPCRLMAPVLKELEQSYKGRAAIIAINLGKDRDNLKNFGVRVIPTQIFYDRDSKEVYRHEGFLDKNSIIERLQILGVGKP